MAETEDLRTRRGMTAKDRHPDPRIIGTAQNDVSSQVYWDVRYHKAREKDGIGHTFEWYCELETVENHFTMVFSDYDAPRLLVLGCGSSKLSEMVYNNGHADITNIDFSAVLISDLKRRYRTYEGMQFFVANAVDLSMFPENSFDIVVDKGCLDCVFASLNGARHAIRACEEVFRVLAPKGRFLMYSCAGPLARKLHLSSPGLDWSVQSTFVGGTSATYYYIMQTEKKYATSKELAAIRAEKAAEAERKAEEDREFLRRNSHISVSSFLGLEPGAGMGAGGAGAGGADSERRKSIVKNLKRLSLSRGGKR